MLVPYQTPSSSYATAYTVYTIANFSFCVKLHTAMILWVLFMIELQTWLRLQALLQNEQEHNIIEKPSRPEAPILMSYLYLCNKTEAIGLVLIQS